MFVHIRYLINGMDSVDEVVELPSEEIDNHINNTILTKLQEQDAPVSVDYQIMTISQLPFKVQCE